MTNKVDKTDRHGSMGDIEKMVRKKEMRRI